MKQALARTDYGRPLDAPRLPPRILIIEDQEREALVLEAILLLSGCYVSRCAGVDEGLWAFWKGNYEAIFMEVCTSEGDGIAGVRRFRSFTSVPIISMTAGDPGRPGRDVLEQALAAGATAAMSKPLNRAKVLDVVHDFVV